MCPYIRIETFKIIILWTGGTNMKHSDNYYFDVIRYNIKKYRKDRNFTQQQLADKAHYSKQFISNIENRTHQTFSVGTLWDLANALEIEMYKLCIEEEYIS